MRNKVAIYPRLSEEDRYKKNQTDESESIQTKNQCSLSMPLNMIGKSTIFTVMKIEAEQTESAPNSTDC